MPNDNSKAYIPQSGMTLDHFTKVQEVAQSEQVIAIIRNTNTASTKLIAMGCPAKPLTVDFHTDGTTGVVTAANPAEIKKAYAAGYFVVDADGVARREVAGQDKTAKQELKIESPFWSIAQGQLIDPVSKKPLVGDYDIHGVINPKNVGQNIALVASNGETLRNIESPIVRSFRTKVNAKLDQPRMMHGAQDQYASFRGGATVFLPDGSVLFLENELKVKEFYDFIGRQTIKGRYSSNPLGAGRRIPVISGSSLTEGGFKGVLANQDVMAYLGQALEGAIQWLGDIGIRRSVEKELTTTYAKEIADNLSRGNGVLVIIHLQEWIEEDFNGMRGRSLLGVSIEGGISQQAALDSWQSQPRLLQGPTDGWRTFDQYMWIEPGR